MIRLLKSNEIVQDLLSQLESGSIPVDSVGKYNEFVKMVRLHYERYLQPLEYRVVIDTAYKILKKEKKN